MSDTPTTPAISAEAAAVEVEGGAFLLDVREPDEWHAGHAPTAHHVPLGELGARIDEIPKDQPIVAICRVGGRSEKATIALRNSGYDAVNLTGGMRAWAAAGLPVVTDDGSHGTVI
jgi:rhodanese-related sulfurtransferase